MDAETASLCLLLLSLSPVNWYRDVSSQLEENEFDVHNVWFKIMWEDQISCHGVGEGEERSMKKMIIFFYEIGFLFG